MQRNSIPPFAAPRPLPVQRASGMNCPDCQGFIPVSIRQLLHDSGIVCPHCGLALTINRMQSKQALDALQKVEEVSRQVDGTATFHR